MHQRCTPHWSISSHRTAVDIDFASLSSTLQARFPSAAAQLVYIVDAATGNLMGSSSPTPTSTLAANTTTRTFLAATASTEPLIADSAQYLEARQWTSALLVFNNIAARPYYVQATRTAAFKGLDLFVVVVMPAPVSNADAVDAASGGGAFVYAVASVGVFVCALTLALVVWYRDTRVIKSAQAELTAVFLLGGIVLNVSALLLVGENTTRACVQRAWLFNLGFTLCLAPLLAKNYWMGRIFNNPELRLVDYGLRDALVIVVALLAIDAALLGAATGTGAGLGAYTVSLVGDDGALAQHTLCATSPIMWVRCMRRGVCASVVTYYLF